MNTTKVLTQRMRLNRQIDFSEDFRKRFVTKEYGNYDKYEKNFVKVNHDRGVDDTGRDKLFKNYNEVIQRTATKEGEEKVKNEEEKFEDMITNESYAN